MFRKPMTKEFKKYRRYKPIKKKASFVWHVVTFLVVSGSQPFVWYDKFRAWAKELL